jgi:4-amino-4-deoxy-L-arabinose transferase-like glycosyltransferase
MKRYLTVLLTIVLIAFGLRVFRLSSRPLGFTWDEAALGYNAYSLLKTARDEHSQLFPIIFRSFGDYKPGLYIYATIPSVAFLGLTEFATRLPSAIFGILLVLTIGLLTWMLFGKKVSLFSACLATINPWAIHFSRGAWEANASLLFTLLGSLLFIRKKYAFSALFLGMTFWTYQGAKLLTPLVIIALLISYKTKITKRIIIPVLILLLFLIPLITNFSTQSGRLVVLGVFSYTRPVAVIANILRQDHLTHPDFYFQLFHAEIIDQLRGITERFLNHYSPQFLFFTGDWSDLRHSTPYFGYFYLTEVITILLGLNFAFRNFTPGVKFLCMWLVFAVLPSAFSRDIVSGVRSLPEVIPLIIFSGLGLAQIFKKHLAFILFSSVTIFLFVYYLDAYYILAPNYTAADWLYPYKPALNAIRPRLTGNEKVVMTNALGQPYIFVLFYYRIDPKLAQKQLISTDINSIDVGEVFSLNQFIFNKFYWPAERGEHSTIFIGDQFELPEQDLHQPNLVRLSDINFPNGKLAWKIVELK